jgi:mono/diheme cytochrome c family protein
MAFSPLTKLVYIPAIESSFVYVNDTEFAYEPGAWNLGIDLAARAGDSATASPLPADAYAEGIGTAAGMPSSLLAWDVAAGRAAWQVPTAGGGGVLATAGNLVFQGAADGHLMAYAADTGQPLWEAQLGNAVMAAPATFALDGKQYVSVLVGWGGAAGLYVPNPTGRYKAEGRLYTFALDATRDFEPVQGIDRPTLTRVDFTTTPERVARGDRAYNQRCSMCHGIDAASGGAIADLRYAAPATYETFDSIVRGGAYQNLGMPMFDYLSAEDVAAMKDYVLTLRAELVAAAGGAR